MNISVPVNNGTEIIERTEISPLVEKCVIKVCYVGEQPNRNHTVITKEVATEMGRKILGSPIVGFYNTDTKDFEGHNRDIEIRNGEFKIVDTTKAYGFVPTDAKVWFQIFNDNGVQHEYLCTEGILWTKAYTEAARILKNGNNQSMEINPETEKGFWTNEINSSDRIFIYNEALIEKLCILGENVEPCFEGAQIKDHFSLAATDFEDFKTRMFELISKLENVVQGGLKNPMENENIVNAPGTQEELENPSVDFEKKEDEKENVSETEEKKEQVSESKEEEKEEKKEEEKKYNLEEVTEYQELMTQYNELQEKYSALETQITDLQSKYSLLETANAELNTFKNETMKKDKLAMVDSFYMLSEEDKKDVLDNLDNYSLEDIESKLAVICFKKKVSFIKEEGEEKESTPTTFSLETAAEIDNAPDWIKAVRENQK